MDTLESVTLTTGAAWASGINLYATLLVLGYLASSGQIVLPPGLEAVADPKFMTVAAILYVIEFFADKAPGIDTGWDALHTFIRIPAGAVLAMGAMGGNSQAAYLAAALAGGALAANSHAIKAGGRILINTSPEPLSNWTVSIGEDIAVLSGLYTALHYPWFFLTGLALFILFSLWIIPRVGKGIQRIARTIRSFF